MEGKETKKWPLRLWAYTCSFLLVNLHKKLLVLVGNTIYFNLAKKCMASAPLLLLLIHSCYKERPLNRRFVEYYATQFIPFQAELFYFKSHSPAKGFQCKSFCGGFSLLIT